MKRRRRRPLSGGLWALWLAAGGCAGAPREAPPPPASMQLEGQVSLDREERLRLLAEIEKDAVQGQIYRIRPGDSLEISVLGEPDLTREVPVRPDGMISYFYVGDVRAGGRTVEELDRAIEEKISASIRQPHVNVIGKKFTGNTVTVLGKVTAPGRKVLTGETRILDVLADAGGFATGYFQTGTVARTLDLADLHRATITRDGKVLPVDFYELVRRGDAAQNIHAKAGDVIYIPSSAENRVFVLGEVNFPTVVQFTEDLRLSEAIATAQGLDQATASKGVVYLVRGGLNHPKVYRVDYAAIEKGRKPDVALQSGDMIYVPAMWVTTMDRVLSQVTTLFTAILLEEEARGALRN